MKAPSLQKTAALSALLHLTLFIVCLSIILCKVIKRVCVRAITSPSGRSVTSRAHHATKHVSRKQAAKKSLHAKRHEEFLKKKEKMLETVRDRMDEERIKDRIAELTAMERIKQLTKLRRVISIPAAGEQPDTKQTSEAQAQGKQSGDATVGNYMDKITGEIWKQWSWDSTMGEKSLEAVISVVISKNGTITIQKIEKSSGNRFFDRSALIALKNASPVTPPPDRSEIEIGIRFFL